MEKIKNCEQCSKEFKYNAPEGFPDRRKYCPVCSAAKKAEWEAKESQTPEVVNLVTGQMSTPASLMSQKDIGMASGGLMHCLSRIAAACIIAQANFDIESVRNDLLDSYNFFVKSFENHGG